MFPHLTESEAYQYPGAENLIQAPELAIYAPRGGMIDAPAVNAAVVEYITNYTAAFTAGAFTAEGSVDDEYIFKNSSMSVMKKEEVDKQTVTIWEDSEVVDLQNANSQYLITIRRKNNKSQKNITSTNNVDNTIVKVKAKRVVLANGCDIPSLLRPKLEIPIVPVLGRVFQFDTAESKNFGKVREV